MYNDVIKFWKLHKLSVVFVVVSILFYVSFGYDLERTSFIKLITLYAGLFYFFYKLIQFEKWNLKFLLISGILFRLVFFLVEPNLSQDFYRFIWDGELIKHGLNPYLYTPNDLIGQNGLPISNADALFAGMGELSAKHFSNYPPVNQIIFALSSLLGGGSILGSIIVMRLFIIFADLGILYFSRKLLQNLNQSNHMAFWYFLNPLVIIELTGNLHFEGVMLFFLVWSLYLISSKKEILAAPIYAVSIMVKLVPLLFLPLFIKHFGFKKSAIFYILIGLSCIVLFLPFYSPVFVSNYSETISLWFSNFEFNAGIYNVVKQIGTNFFDAKPWELVKSYGKLVAILVMVITLLMAFVRKNQNLSTLITSMLIALSLYYFLSSTVHPWYIIFLVGLSIFTRYRYPIVWSFAVILSYWAYSNPDYTENLWLLAIEYILVFGYLIYEIVGKGQKKLYFFKK
ncbi:polyprenol phosphomannose-dependent alpha 1,6 mannosyltransferase MptB [Flagellimonas eckloniae]|uniref:Mannosyltransferase n=1 Tax=Flagellimonas eckloniae TaxID=346185 RepID=A0A0N8WGB4_9FLAO|nr:polyprenol phosphomannose-dependent alpha 1,6 mannosyltransferase MptB [Allomuricauda eckloniae]KQC31027.1 mannosyltransferase [Allomuricauda eckloniae]